MRKQNMRFIRALKKDAHINEITYVYKVNKMA